MILTEKIKEKIKTEYTSWFNNQYGNISKEERDELGAVFTPADVTIQMIEKFDGITDKDILDPTCGSGNLLAACIIAGADPKRIYGNEFNKEFLQLAKDRLCKMGVPEENLHQGDATDSYCLTNWGKDYKWPKPEPKKTILW